MKQTVLMLLVGVLAVTGVSARELPKLRERLTSTNAAERAMVRLSVGAEASGAAEAAGYDAEACCDIAVASTNRALAAMAIREVGPQKKARTAVDLVLRTRDCGDAYTLLRIPGVRKGMTEGQWRELSAAGLGAGANDTFASFVVPPLISNRWVRGLENVETDPLVSALLCGEPRLHVAYVNGVKAALKERCESAAKVSLRKAGKSFVTRTVAAKSAGGAETSVVVNPLRDAVKPVIDALNAPECAGLEAALRGFGFEVADKDRTRLRTEVRSLADNIMNGQVPAAPGRDGSIAVLLGVDGYNAWVRKYNEGEVAGGGE